MAVSNSTIINSLFKLLDVVFSMEMEVQDLVGVKEEVDLVMVTISVLVLPLIILVTMLIYLRVKFVASLGMLLCIAGTGSIRIFNLQRIINVLQWLLPPLNLVMKVGSWIQELLIMLLQI